MANVNTLMREERPNVETFSRTVEAAAAVLANPKTNTAEARVALSDAIKRETYERSRYMMKHLIGEAR